MQKQNAKPQVEVKYKDYSTVQVGTARQEWKYVRVLYAILQYTPEVISCHFIHPWSSIAEDMHLPVEGKNSLSFVSKNSKAVN